jgi:hypothetical protein
VRDSSYEPLRRPTEASRPSVVVGLAARLTCEGVPITNSLGSDELWPLNTRDPARRQPFDRVWANFLPPILRVHNGIGGAVDLVRKAALRADQVEDERHEDKATRAGRGDWPKTVVRIAVKPRADGGHHHEGGSK